ncbi:MAG: SAM-dependent methyltransferase [Flavobacteriales bacterium]|jgi:thiopurine S-methyltransferase|nr:SAM-dependent methyltransferase [Flavobacteriales bacterium]
MNLAHDFWHQRYATGETGWDLGAPSTPLKEYLDQLTDKEQRILIPGGGRAWEAEYAHRLGFQNVLVLDLTDAPLNDLLERCPDFPRAHFIVGDFFAHRGRYDLILEQTFFCAIDPVLREQYVAQMHRLLNPGGKLAGVLFNDALNADKPPFGGFLNDYLPLFRPWFPSVTMEPCRNSIAPRAGRELWLNAEKHKPVGCELLDRFEDAALKQMPVVLHLNDGQKLACRISSIIARDGADWLILHGGKQLRADSVASME